MQADQTGAIYDLGYRHYEGERGSYGRVLLTLYLESLRIAFGIGRKFVYKFAPLLLLLIAIVPAAIALGIASVIGEEQSPYEYEGYYFVVAVAIMLYCAVVAPDLVGRDIRNRSLPLYISRGITRLDYIAVKIAALVSATLIFSLIPQFLLFAGNTLAARNGLTYVWENIEVIPQIAASALIIGLLLGTIAVAFAAHATNRAYATGGFVALIILSTAVTNILLEINGGAFWRYFWTLGTFNLMEGAIRAVFGTDFEFDSSGYEADLWPGWYIIVALGTSAAAVGLTVRRYLGLKL